MPRRTREQVIAEFHRLYDCSGAATEAFQGLETMWESESPGQSVVTRNRPDQAALFQHRYAAIRGTSFNQDTARQPSPETTP